jgi:hypothetical protein
MLMNAQRTLLAATLSSLTLLASATASAQYGGGVNWNPAAGGQPVYQGPNGYGAPVGGPVVSSGGPSRDSSNLEIGFLYAAATAYGVGTGVWLDAELGIKDPGLRFIAPIVGGVGAPVGVFFLDQPKLPRGVPAAISTGMMIGAGEGFGIWSYQFVSSNSENSWGFKELARSTFIGSTLGAGAGAAIGFTQEPSPKLSLFLGSSVMWGSAVGTMFGFGASSKDSNYGKSNDSASLGGLIGFNAGLAAAAGLSAAWIPNYKQLAFMWMGAGLGFAATLPVYVFYAGNDDYSAKRGMIVQGIGTTLGLAAGAIFTMYDQDWVVGLDDKGQRNQPAFVQLTGVGPMAVPGGMGAQLSGVLF